MVEKSMAARILARNEADEKAFFAALVAGGATPEQLYHAGIRRGIALGAFEDGIACAAGVQAEKST